MTTPIELPCICHVPPQLAKRLKLCVDTISGYSRFSPGQDGYQALKELKEFVESIQSKDEYIYPTPVEACRMIADAGNYVLCEFLSSHGEWCHGKLRWGDVETTCVVPMPYCILNYGWVEKIRVPKPKP